MAQINIRPDEANSWVSVETSFCVPGSYTQAYPIAGTVELDLQRDEYPVDKQSPYLYDYQEPVKGPKKGTVKFGAYVCPPTQLAGASASPATWWLGELLEAAFGEEVAAAGGAVASASSETAFSVTAGQGSRFQDGAWMGALVSGAIEPTRVASVATDALTAALALSAQPSVADCVNGYNYHPHPTFTKSLSFRHNVVGDNATQWQADGCVTQVQFKTDANGLLRCDFELALADYTGPADQSLADTYAADPLGAPFAVQDATMLLQTTATTTRTQYHLHSFAVKLNHGTVHLPSLGGVSGALTTQGVMRTGQRLFAEATLRFQYDPAADATWYAEASGTRSDLQCVVMFPQGATTTKRWSIFDLPKCKLVGKPKVVRDGGFLLTEVTLHAMIPDTAGATAISRAPFVFAVL